MTTVQRKPWRRRIETEVGRRGVDECWPWLGGTRTICVENEAWTLSRAVYRYHTGQATNVRRTCKTPNCCNIRHIEPTDEVTRFWSKVDKTPGLGPNGECWFWLAGVDRDGYGRFWFDGETNRAHRYAFRSAHGYLPKPDILIRHTCNTPGCVNPDHLRTGNAADNVQDRQVAGNTARGEKQAGHKLSNDAVMEIREAYVAGQGTKALASRFGVAEVTVDSAGAGRTWRHLPMPLGCRPRKYKLTYDVACEIRVLRLLGLTYNELAQQYGVTRHQIRNVCTYKSWVKP